MSMDEDEEYADERDELLNRFRQCLSKPVAERFFDEDDLIEIFDYAGDLNDDYLRLEALMCGARFFPDSEPLLERRAIFYSQYSDDARSQFLADNPSQGNMILEMLEARNSQESPEEKKKRIEKLINDYDQLADEEVIQLVDLASSQGLFQWLKGKMPTLRKKVQYINILIYEMAIAADMNNDHSFSVEMLEELTQIEPFNSYYWMQLAKQYSSVGENEKALSAIDYSLAIKPDASDAVLVKASILYTMGRPAADIIEMLNDDISKGGALFESVKFLATIYDNEGHRDHARQLMQEALKAYPDRELEIIPELLVYDPENAEELFDRFYALSEDKSQMVWATWAQQFVMQGYPELARKALRAFEKNSGITLPSIFSIEDLFIARKYGETINEIDNYLKEFGIAESSFPALMAMHLVALIKDGQDARACAMCVYITTHMEISDQKTLQNRLEFMGLMEIVQQYAAKLKSGAWNREDFDPLGYWQTNS